MSCNWRIANHKREVCIPKELGKYMQPKVKLNSNAVMCSFPYEIIFFLHSKSNSKMSNSYYPEAARTSTTARTSTQFGNVNFNVILK